MNAPPLQPCNEHGHQKGEPPCFHNIGGEYLFIRKLKGGIVLLEHIQTLKVGLAHVKQILPDEP